MRPAEFLTYNKDSSLERAADFERAPRKCAGGPIEHDRRGAGPRCDLVPGPLEADDVADDVGPKGSRRTGDRRRAVAYGVGDAVLGAVLLRPVGSRRAGDEAAAVGGGARAGADFEDSGRGEGHTGMKSEK